MRFSLEWLDVERFLDQVWAQNGKLHDALAFIYGTHSPDLEDVQVWYLPSTIAPLVCRTGTAS
jgi:hypothetical protein